MTIETDIITNLNCSNLAASELSTHGQKLATSLAALTNRYSTDHLIESRALADKLGMYEAKKKVKQGYGLLGRIGHAKTSILPAPVKTMWQAWLDTGNSYSDFRSVCEAHSIGMANNEAVTAILEVLHTSNRLHQPERVIEGRQVYNTLMKEYQLCQRLGLMKEQTNGFWSNRQGGI